MASLSVLIKLIQNLTEKFNLWETNAKKVDELPHQLSLVPSSKIHVSRAGTSEFLTIQQVVNAATNNQNDQILSIGNLSLVSNDLTIPAGVSWKINNTVYSKETDTVINIPLAATGLSRKDIIIADNTGLITRVSGNETAGSIVVAPTLPLNSLLITEIDISDSSIGTPTDPVVGLSGNKGYWNAATNTPYLVNGVGQIGDYYTVSTQGTFEGLLYKVGDRIEFDGSNWYKAINNNQSIDISGKENKSEKGQPNGYASLGADGKVPLAELPQINNDLYRSWQWVASSLEASGLLFSGITSINRYAEYGTRSFVSVAGTTRLNSIPFQNYAGASGINSQVGLKQINNADGVYRQGFDNYFVFGNNDTNVNCDTTVGHYGSLATTIQNNAKSEFTTDFVGVGNDVGDTNLSFYAHRVPVSGQTANYVKVPCGSSFPAHDTSSAYLLRMEAPQTEIDANRYVKLTITNLTTGVTFTHTFTHTETPVLNRPYATTVIRSSRNSGVATNIKFGKIQVIRKMF